MDCVLRAQTVVASTPPQPFRPSHTRGHTKGPGGLPHRARTPFLNVHFTFERVFTVVFRATIRHRDGVGIPISEDHETLTWCLVGGLNGAISGQAIINKSNNKVKYF